MGDMLNKYDKPLFLALRELMKAKLYDSVEKVIDTALLDNVPLEDIQEITEELKGDEEVG